MHLATQHKVERAHDCIYCGNRLNVGDRELRCNNRGYHLTCFGKMLVSDTEEYLEKYGGE